MTLDVSAAAAIQVLPDSDMAQSVTVTVPASGPGAGAPGLATGSIMISQPGLSGVN